MQRKWEHVNPDRTSGMFMVSPSQISHIVQMCLIINERSGEKTNNVVSEQVRYKSGCTVTEAG